MQQNTCETKTRANITIVTSTRLVSLKYILKIKFTLNLAENSIHLRDK
jgi:hypothetical protein